jgi:hypothetical protein
MRIHEFGAFTWAPYGCQTWSPTQPSNPGLKSSALHRKNEGFPGSGGLESGPPGPDFEGFRAKAEGSNPRIRECQWTAKPTGKTLRDRI